MLIHVFSQRRYPRFDRLLRIHTEAGAVRPPYDADGAVEEVDGGPIEVMPGEPRAGITEDVLAEIKVSGILDEGTHGDGRTEAGARSRWLTSAPGRLCRRAWTTTTSTSTPDNATHWPPGDCQGTSEGDQEVRQWRRRRTPQFGCKIYRAARLATLRSTTVPMASPAKRFSIILLQYS